MTLFKDLLPVLLAFVAGFGIGGLYFAGTVPEVSLSPTVESPNVDTTNNNSISVTVESLPNNNIQANHHDVEYEGYSDGVAVGGLDLTIDLHGSSMQPTFFTGHTALAKTYDGSRLDEGTIVYTDNNIVHRVKGEYIPSGDQYLLQGDNTDEPHYVDADDIDAVVVGILYTQP